MALYRAFLFLLFAVGLFMAAFVYLNGKKKAANITLSFFNIIFAFWCFGQLMGEVTASRAGVMFWTRFNLSAAVFIPVLFLNFIYAFLDKIEEKKKYIYASYLAGALLLLLIQTPYFIVSLAQTKHFRYYPQAGTAYALFAFIFVIQVLIGLFELLKAYFNLKGEKRNQSAYIILASIVGFVGGAFWFLPAFGADIYPFGIFIVPFYTFITAYAIVRHRLLDIKVFIKEGIVYAILLGVFSSFYILMVVIAGNIIQDIMGIRSIFINIAALFFFSILFNPAYKMLDGLIGRLLTKGPDRQTILKRLSLDILSCKSVPDFAKVSVSSIKKNLDAESAVLFLPDSIRDLSVQIKKCVSPEEVDDMPTRGMFERAGARIIVPMVFGEEVLGYFAIGAKNNGDIWAKDDIGMLETFSRQSAVSLKNAMLCEEIMESQYMFYRAEKLSAIGTIASEMAHEIKNPLTAIKGMAQVLNRNRDDKEFLESFEKIILRQIDRINATVEKLLGLGKTAKGEAGSLDEIKINSVEETIDDILALFRSQCESKNISISKQNHSDINILCAREQLTQALLNIILNAIEAMPNGGDLRVILNKGELSISDTGSGIKEENIQKILEPFFSTKQDGAGLGLAVASRIINDIGAELSVKSKEGFGTTFTIKFGNIQKEAQ